MFQEFEHHSYLLTTRERPSDPSLKKHFAFFEGRRIAPVGVQIIRDYLFGFDSSVA
jgi:hypothetical protein